jgi:hypothetical protein
MSVELLFDASSAVHLRSSSCFTPDVFNDAFFVDAHYQGSLPQQLDVVWNPIL